MPAHPRLTLSDLVPSNYTPVIINAALTGAVPSPEKFPTLPVTPTDIAHQALACAEAGAAIVHLHMRDDNGLATQDRERFAETVGLIREHNSDLIICGTTTSRGAPTLSDRMDYLTLPPDTRPELASLTLGSYNTPTGINHNPEDEIIALAETMADNDITPEFEIFEPGMVETFFRLRDRGLFSRKPYFNILLGVQGASPATPTALFHIVEKLPPDAVWSVAGIGHFQKPMNALAIAAGGHVRVGMEDDPRGEQDGWTNLDSVKRVVHLARGIDRPISTKAETRIGLALSVATTLPNNESITEVPGPVQLDRGPGSHPMKWGFPA
jgi:3-keto-5-aminohexanoate cleavage enzyme